MDSANVVDHLIIGTGPSAVAAAMAFRRSGMTFEVVDVGFELEPERESRAKGLARQEPEAWSDEDRNILFPPPKTSTEGVEKRFSFGSDFPYRVPEPLELRAENCVVGVSTVSAGSGMSGGLPSCRSPITIWSVGRFGPQISCRLIGTLRHTFA